jgi:hypothetical protein
MEGFDTEVDVNDGFLQPSVGVTPPAMSHVRPVAPAAGERLFGGGISRGIP